MNNDEGSGDLLKGGLALLGRIDSIFSMGILLVFVVAVLAIIAFGPSIKLTCTREGAAGVRCNFEERIIVWPVTVGGLGYVTGAINDQRCNNSGCTYRVVLVTPEGKRPLRDEYSSGSKADFINKLNSFIADKNQARIELIDNGELSPQFSANCLIPLLVIGLASLSLLFLFWGYRSRRNQ